MKKMISGCVAALLLFAGISLLSPTRVVAQTPVCGPASTWNGQTCIGPRGKAYCPADMTMEGQTCVSQVTQQNRVMQVTAPASLVSPVASAGVGNVNDHQRILAMLSQQQSVINDLQQKLIAMQIVMNLMAANVEKTREAALSAQASAAAAQTSAAAAQQTAANNQSGVSQAQLATNVNILLANDKTLMADDQALQAKQTDIARRLYYTCLTAQGIQNGIGSDQLNANACTSTFWSNQPHWNWDLPFKSP